MSIQDYERQRDYERGYREGASRQGKSVSAKLVRIAELEVKYRRLADAVKALPVEKWMQRDGNGDPELLGYTMQAEGEWDAVLAILQEAE